MFARFVTTAFAITFALASANAQLCAPAAIPLGQPGLIGIAPVCVGAIPVPALPGGNPGFGIATMPLPTPPSFVFLVFSGFAPPPFAALPAAMTCAPFGLPALLPTAYLGAFFLGVTPGPLPVFPLPVPPGILPGTLFLTVQTAAFVPGPGCVALSNGTTITN
ncbi:MAG: hypothetical protein WAT39_00780 [Planctomycetota bacterium]